VHGFPNDYWRFTAEGFRELGKRFAWCATFYGGDPLFPHSVALIAARRAPDPATLARLVEALKTLTPVPHYADRKTDMAIAALSGLLLDRARAAGVGEAAAQGDMGLLSVAGWTLLPGTWIKIALPDARAEARIELDFAGRGAMQSVPRAAWNVLRGGEGDGPAETAFQFEPAPGTPSGVGQIEARLVGVDRVADSVAEGIRKAVDQGAQVISISLGGFGGHLISVVGAAIKYGAEKGVVFVAAAGNGLGNIGGPAAYPGFDYHCACIAGSTAQDTGWGGSLGGPAVTVSAPAHGVWSAWREPGDNPQTATRRVGAGSGTTYSTAIVGGVAALWIAHHGHANLIGRFGPTHVTKVFQYLLRASARVPSGWSSWYYGAGIVDAGALLRMPLPKDASLDAASLDSPQDELRRDLRARLEAGGAEPSAVARLDDAFLDRYGRELGAHLALAEYRRAATTAGAPGAAGQPAGAALSQTLRAALATAGAASVAVALDA
jgi:hypothetical protein